MASDVKVEQRHRDAALLWLTQHDRPPLNEAFANFEASRTPATDGVVHTPIEAVARALSCHLWATIVRDNNDDCGEFDAMPEYIKGIYRKAAEVAIRALGAVT